MSIENETIIGCRCGHIHAGVLKHFPWWAFWRPAWNKDRKLRSERRTWLCRHCGRNWPKNAPPHPPAPPRDWRESEDYRHLPEAMAFDPFILWWDNHLLKTPECPQCRQKPHHGRFFQSQDRSGKPLRKAVVCHCGGLLAISEAA